MPWHNWQPRPALNAMFSLPSEPHYRLFRHIAGAYPNFACTLSGAPKASASELLQVLLISSICLPLGARAYKETFGQYCTHRRCFAL
jgi:hypothetical protein